jgi:hypothetical protein
MATEQDVGVINQVTSTVAPVRTIAVTTLIAGTPTTVQMQVVAVADEGGNVIRDFANYNLQLAMLTELRAIRSLLSRQSGGFDVIPDLPFVVGQQQ